MLVPTSNQAVDAASDPTGTAVVEAVPSLPDAAEADNDDAETVAEDDDVTDEPLLDEIRCPNCTRRVSARRRSTLRVRRSASG